MIEAVDKAYRSVKDAFSSIEQWEEYAHLADIAEIQHDYIEEVSKLVGSRYGGIINFISRLSLISFYSSQIMHYITGDEIGDDMDRCEMGKYSIRENIEKLKKWKDDYYMEMLNDKERLL